MDNTKFRQGTKIFYDNKKFAHGFAKSGEFTFAEEDILMTYGDTCSKLTSGELEATNHEEQHFLHILECHEDATTKIEKTWLKYIKLVNTRKQFHTLSGNGKIEALENFFS